LNPTSLKSSLPKGQLSTNVDEIIGKMNDLKRLRHHLFNLDDFGHGVFIRLAFLKRLPI